jgi:hypothetical protein
VDRVWLWSDWPLNFGVLRVPTRRVQTRSTLGFVRFVSHRAYLRLKLPNERRVPEPERLRFRHVFGKIFKLSHYLAFESNCKALKSRGLEK